MTSINEVIAHIRYFLTENFNQFDAWFDKPVELRTYKPKNGGWSIDQILEHVSLTNHFLLILIEKGARKAINLATSIDYKKELNDYVFQKDRLDEVGQHVTNQWIRPEHMEPVGKPIEEVRILLKEQFGQCIVYLELLKNGEGILHETTMTVNNFGKLDVYEYIYFLGQHVHRHIMQMVKNEAEYNS
jgi:hypothetical protein